MVCPGFSVSTPVGVETPDLHSFSPSSHWPIRSSRKCTLHWCQGTAYHFHYSQRAIEPGVYSKRRAWHALLGVSQASTICNYTVWLNFLRPNGVSTLGQSGLRMKLFLPPSGWLSIWWWALLLSEAKVWADQDWVHAVACFKENKIQFPNVPIWKRTMQAWGKTYIYRFYLPVRRYQAVQHSSPLNASDFCIISASPSSTQRAKM